MSKCAFCGATVHKENMFTSFVPTPPTPSQVKVCGRCYVLVSILDTLRRIENYGKPKGPGSSKPDGDVG
jgi:hypothetical protein